MNRSSQITRQCLGCGKDFQPPMRDVNRGYGKYCSLKCAAPNKPHPKTGNRISLVCALCGITFERLVGHTVKARHGIHFCSRKCKDVGQRLESGITAIHPYHYGTADDLDSDTYRQLAFRHHPARCNRCGYNRFKSVLRVHHIDRDRSNRDPNNLEILCPTCHEEEHYLAGDGLYTGMKLVDLEGLESSTSPVQAGCYSI